MDQPPGPGASLKQTNTERPEEINKYLPTSAFKTSSAQAQAQHHHQSRPLLAMAIDEKHTLDDSESATLQSVAGSLNNDKAHEADDSVREGSQVQTPAVDSSNTDHDNEGGLNQVQSRQSRHSTTAKEAQDELTRVMTSGEGIEYPTGLKLNCKTPDF